MATSVMGSPVPFPREVLYAVAAAAIAWCAVRALEWAWWRPRRLDRALRSQGLRGTAYRPVAGDVQLSQRLSREARSRTMPLRCHDVVPRAMPLLHQAAKEHADVAGFRCVLHGAGTPVGRFSRRRCPVRGGCLARDAELDGRHHLPRRVRQQLPRRQEDLTASGRENRARHVCHEQDAHSWLLTALRGGEATSEHGALQGRWHHDRRRGRRVQAVLLRRHGDHGGAAHVDDGRALHAPGVAGPRQGGGHACFRRRHYSRLRWLRAHEDRDHGAVRGAAVVHAADGAPAQDVQADGPRRRQVSGGRGVHAAAAMRPPRQGGLGHGCRRVQAREVRRGDCEGVGGRAGVLPVRVGPTDLRRPELRAARGQDGACHDPATLLLGALAVLCARALPRRHAAARARRANQAQEAPLSCILQLHLHAHHNRVVGSCSW